MTEEPDLIMSPLCQAVTQDDYTVQVHIYCTEPNAWVLEVVDETSASTVWDEHFATDALALEEFRRTVDQDGIRSFEEPQS